jgi:hypothetical protein
MVRVATVERWYVDGLFKIFQVRADRPALLWGIVRIANDERWCVDELFKIFYTRLCP